MFEAKATSPLTRMTNVFFACAEDGAIHRDLKQKGLPTEEIACEGNLA